MCRSAGLKGDVWQLHLKNAPNPKRNALYLPIPHHSWSDTYWMPHWFPCFLFPVDVDKLLLQPNTGRRDPCGHRHVTTAAN
ncbi:hypothetical protein GDO78_019081 [Eleutherodactylus coqui]|uniref:Uncharacterized protein n=1 Tax=Eleutherodactylus coqui TaxID=57060 RepID=A0A8J6JZT6_ELECQ|nr:hypothetical protein GDO78_019081 [Eleutherodactylus coqui]